jgi:hypothetical protein
MQINIGYYMFDGSKIPAVKPNCVDAVEDGNADNRDIQPHY